MTDEQFIEMKDEYLDNMKSILLRAGNIQPTITILGDHRKENKPAIIHIPLPEKIANSDEGKQMFVDEMIPELSIKVQERFDVKAVAFASEAWMRTAEKDEFDPEVDNYKKLPIKKEILIITIDDGKETFCNIFEIKRDGKSVTPEGDLIDIIELEKLPDLEAPYSASGGRFGKLYQKFTKQ
jgi:hypothetical protein